MKIELRQLSLTDGTEITEMLQEIGPGENGFENTGYDTPLDEYLEKYNKQSQGIDLPEGYVPQTIYRLYIDNIPVGYGKLRHHLTEFLIKAGGHSGYCIRPSARGKGYGNIILQELIKKAQEKGITKMLLTCNPDNTPSRKIIEKNGGILENIEEKCRYWIDIK
ncbi:MAG: GNAT family N-acetyltransferase [Candidatus Absconditabacteria bacterium]